MAGYHDIDNPSPPLEHDPHFTTTHHAYNDFDPWNSPPRAWTEPYYVLASLVTGQELILAHPSEGRIARRREWDRRTNRGQNVDYNWNGSIYNEMRSQWWTDANRKWRRERGLQRIGMADFKPMRWDRPAMLKMVEVSPKTLVPAEMEVNPFDVQAESSDVGVQAESSGDQSSSSLASLPSSLDQLIPKAPGAQKLLREVTQHDLGSKWSLSTTSSHGGEGPASPRRNSSDSQANSFESYEAFTNWFHAEQERIKQAQAEADKGSQSSIADIDDSQTSLPSLTESEEPVVEEATTARVVRARDENDLPIIAQATTARVLHAPYIPVPPRHQSLLGTRVLQAGIASQARRIRRASTPVRLSQNVSNTSLSALATENASGVSPLRRQSRFAEMFSGVGDDDSVAARQVRITLWGRIKRRFSCFGV